MHTYRNINTGDVHTFAEPHPELEALDNWVTVADAEVPDSAHRALAVAEAERAAIEQAQGHRYDRTLADGQGAANEYGNRSTSRDGGPPAPVRPVGIAPTGVAVPVLSNPDLKIGGLHDATDGPGGRRAVADLAAAQAASPPRDGVLARAKADQRSGAVQIGDNPQEHDAIRDAIRPAGKPATKRARAKGDTKPATEPATEPVTEDGGGKPAAEPAAGGDGPDPDKAPDA